MFLHDSEEKPMKYLYYNPMLSVNSPECETDYKAFQERCREYRSVFSQFEECFSKKFVSTYNKDGFHDYELSGLEYTKPSRGCIKLSFVDVDLDMQYDLVFKGVVSLECRFKEFGFRKQQVLTYEILPAEDGCFSHEFWLCSDEEGTLKIIAKKVVFRSSRRPIKQNQ